MLAADYVDEKRIRACCAASRMGVPGQGRLFTAADTVLGNQPRCMTKITAEKNHASVARMPKTEHIMLESEPRQVPELRDARSSHARIEFRSRLRSRILQLEIIDYYYLSV